MEKEILLRVVKLVGMLIVMVFLLWKVMAWLGVEDWGGLIQMVLIALIILFSSLTNAEREFTKIVRSLDKEVTDKKLVYHSFLRNRVHYVCSLVDFMNTWQFSPVMVWSVCLSLPEATARDLCATIIERLEDYLHHELGSRDSKLTFNPHAKYFYLHISLIMSTGNARSYLPKVQAFMEHMVDEYELSKVRQFIHGESNGVNYYLRYEAGNVTDSFCIDKGVVCDLEDYDFLLLYSDNEEDNKQQEATEVLISEQEYEEKKQTGI